MLLQQVVALLDAELERLGTLRTIVSGLSATGLDALDEQNAPGPEALVEPMEAVLPETKPVRQVKARQPTTRQTTPRRSASQTKPAVRSTSALQGAIPNAPVVVRRDALQSEHARRQQMRESARESKPKEEFGSLGAMIRALRPESHA